MASACFFCLACVLLSFCWLSSCLSRLIGVFTAMLVLCDLFVPLLFFICRVFVFALRTLFLALRVLSFVSCVLVLVCRASVFVLRTWFLFLHALFIVLRAFVFVLRALFLSYVLLGLSCGFCVYLVRFVNCLCR